jgi:hypothetical protein
VTIEGFSKTEIKGYVDWKPSTNSAATAGGNAGVSGSEIISGSEVVSGSEKA